MKKYIMWYSKLNYKAVGYYKNEKEARRSFKDIYGVEPDEITVGDIVEDDSD